MKAVEMKTTETVEESGIYSSECCNVQATFEVGDTFSRCPQCQHLCGWDFESELVLTEGTNEDGIAA